VKNSAGASDNARTLKPFLAAIGLVPVRPGRSFARCFARRPHERGNVGIRNREAGRIDRSGERRIFQPPPKSSQIKPVEPQRRLVWVKSAALTVGRSLPVYPDNRTSSVSAATSQKCQADIGSPIRLPRRQVQGSG
jgi:hypothetical protein